MTNIFVQTPNSYNILLDAFASFTVGVPWSRVSSTNFWCVEVGKFSKGLMPTISLVVVALFMLLLSPSIIRMNMKGDRKSHCRMPLEGHKGLAVAPLIKSE